MDISINYMCRAFSCCNSFIAGEPCLQTNCHYYARANILPTYNHFNERSHHRAFTSYLSTTAVPCQWIKRYRSVIMTVNAVIETHDENMVYTNNGIGNHSRRAMGNNNQHGKITRAITCGVGIVPSTRQAETYPSCPSPAISAEQPFVRGERFFETTEIIVQKSCGFSGLTAVTHIIEGLFTVMVGTSFTRSRQYLPVECP